MIKVLCKSFSPFAVNSYLLAAENNECIIVDPGCYGDDEEKTFWDWIEGNALKPMRLVNTHAHIDHVFGNAFIYGAYGLSPEMGKEDEFLLDHNPSSAAMFGLSYITSPRPKDYIGEGDELMLDGMPLEIRHVPGHSPGHMVIVNHQDRWVIAGDTLFRYSIGRTDLPGGNYDQLIASITKQLLTLPEDYMVYSGHGPETTIGTEAKNNPFLS